MPHPINHNFGNVHTSQGQREKRLHVTDPKLLIFAPEILLNSLHGRWRAAGTVPTQAPRVLWQGRASTELPGSFQPKQIWDPGGNRCLWGKQRVAKHETELCSQLSVPHRGGEQPREMLGRKQQAARGNSSDAKRLG